MRSVGTLGPNRCVNEAIARWTECDTSAALYMESVGSGRKEAQIKAAQRADFGDLQEYSERLKQTIVDDVGILSSTHREELPVIVPTAMRAELLKYVHGSRLNGHYKLSRTMSKLVRRYWLKNMGLGRDAVAMIRDCLQCTVADDRQPGTQVPL